VLGSILWLAPL